ncbi:FCD domain-containing protein [Parasedimentitalea maritima]|uniref:FCD domain-containing protein n=1 Tax=Parasedimentitalea maritima TaxID=2578117 RepID=A0A6A4RJN0_9RHOB|nr:FCD domain-containing protein [Zongyanglinia marina]
MKANKVLNHIKPLVAGRDVLDALVELIEAAKLTVGDKLPPEVELARRLGVGRSKIREALNAWQKMGIVVRNKGAGTRLAAEIASHSVHMPLTLKLEAESLLRTHAVRRPLEIEAVRLATVEATDQQRKVILARMAELMAVYEAGEDWRPADHRFHNEIFAATGNPLFGQLIAQIQKAFQDIYEAPFGKPHLGQNSIVLHRPMAEAIASGDQISAVNYTTQIMDIVEAEVREIIGAGK